MNDKNWKKELDQLIQNKKCTDSDIEDFIQNHDELNGKDVWDYVSELTSPEICKGCVYIQMSGMYPCNVCVRQNQLKDFYKSK